MKNIKFLFTVDWDFDLYQVGDEKVITINYTSPTTDFFRSFILNGEERNIPNYQLHELVQKIRDNYNFYKDREIDPIFLTRTEIEDQQ